MISSFLVAVEFWGFFGILWDSSGFSGILQDFFINLNRILPFSRDSLGFLRILKDSLGFLRDYFGFFGIFNRILPFQRDSLGFLRIL